MKISFADYFAFEKTYYKDKRGQRLGQAFINTFYDKIKEPDPILFNETSDRKATDIIMQKYVA